MTTPPAHDTRLERILGVPLSDDAMRQWPQSGEVINGRERISEVESHFEGLRLAVGRRHTCGDTLVVEWSPRLRSLVAILVRDLDAPSRSRPGGRFGPKPSGACRRSVGGS
jgi:hypothetical protein